MQAWPRLWATIAIWTALMVILGVFLTLADTSHIGGSNTTVIVITLALTAAASTWAVWVRASGEPVQVERQDVGKAKRLDPRRVERLIEMLGEDEIVELETLLSCENEGARAARR